MRNLSKSLDTCTLQHDIDLLKASLERGLCQLGDPLRLPCKLHLYARVYDRLSRENKKKPRHLNPSVSPCSVLEIKTSLALGRRNASGTILRTGHSVRKEVLLGIADRLRVMGDEHREGRHLLHLSAVRQRHLTVPGLCLGQWIHLHGAREGHDAPPGFGVGRQRGTQTQGLASFNLNVYLLHLYN